MSVWTPETEARLWDHYDAHGPDYALLADLLSSEFAPFTRSQVRHRILKGRRPQAEPTDGHRSGSEPNVVTSAPSPTVCTLEDLLAQAQVDLDVWTVERHVVNSWEQRPGEQLFQVKAWLARKVPEDFALLREALLADVAERAAQRPILRLKTPTVSQGEACMLEVNVADLHIGKLGWGEEVGHDYDQRIAEQCARNAVADLLWQAGRFRIEKIVLPFGNDFLHYDTPTGTTTAGTPQDRDTRWLKMFRKGAAVASWMVEHCARVAPVEVVVIPGNHATHAELALGELLAAEYKRDPRVTFNNPPTPRKYVQWGKNLIGYVHGDREKHDMLPQLMAVEQPELWAQTTYREFHLGHFHIQRAKAPMVVDDKTGVTVRIVRSLSGTDSWHAASGYVGNVRGAEAFVYRESGGLRAHLFTYADDVPLAA